MDGEAAQAQGTRWGGVQGVPLRRVRSAVPGEMDDAVARAQHPPRWQEEDIVRSVRPHRSRSERLSAPALGTSGAVRAVQRRVSVECSPEETRYLRP